MVAAARGAGKTAGIFLASPDQVPAALADGFRMIALGSDGGFMMKAAREEMEASRRARRRRAERGAHHVGAQVAQRPQEAARGGQGVAVLFARPLGLVARLDEVRQRMPPGVQARRAHDQRADALLERVLAELVGQGGQLAHLEHVVDRHLRRAEALGADHLDRVRGRGDLRLAQIEAREHDGFTVETLRDVDASVLHVPTLTATLDRRLIFHYPVGQFAYQGYAPCMPSPEAPLAGSCACGTVQFQVTAEFNTAGYCHCTRCQRRTACRGR